MFMPLLKASAFVSFILWTIKSNIIGTENILKAAIEKNVKVVCKYR